MRIVVAEARLPAVPDEADPRAPALVAELSQRGHEVERVSLPYNGTGRDVRAQAGAWRLLDLSVAGGRPIDLLIAVGFPAYFARHPRKVAWLTDPHDVPSALAELDARMRRECARIVTAALYDPRLVDQLLG